MPHLGLVWLPVSRSASCPCPGEHCTHGRKLATNFTPCGFRRGRPDLRRCGLPVPAGSWPCHRRVTDRDRDEATRVESGEKVCGETVMADGISPDRGRAHGGLGERGSRQGQWSGTRAQRIYCAARTGITPSLLFLVCISSACGWMQTTPGASKLELTGFYPS